MAVQPGPMNNFPPQFQTNSYLIPNFVRLLLSAACFTSSRGISFIHPRDRNNNKITKEKLKKSPHVDNPFLCCESEWNVVVQHCETRSSNFYTCGLHIFSSQVYQFVGFPFIHLQLLRIPFAFEFLLMLMGAVIHPV